MSASHERFTLLIKLRIGKEATPHLRRLHARSRAFRRTEVFMNKPKARIENIVVQEFANEILIYDLKTNKAYCLNETSAIIYQMCDGKHSVEQISQSLSQELKQPITEDFIWLALDSFKKDNLLEQSEKFAINFNGLSRRQVIKKIGLGSLVVLPVIASVVAPAAAATASLAPYLAPCASPSQCQSGTCGTATSRCCVTGTTLGLIGATFCCADPPSCNQVCCSGSGTIETFAPCNIFGGLRVICP
ncbi:MAG: PqqD family protein [Acidobacteriota bacterium]